MTEKVIVNSILRYLNALPLCRAEKTWGGGYGNAGKPGITGCLRGRRALNWKSKKPGANQPSCRRSRSAKMVRGRGNYRRGSQR